MSSKHFEALVVRAVLATPLSIEEPIHLEGILYDARFRRDPGTKGTPLACIAYQDGIPKVSASVLVEGGMGITYGSVTAVRGVRLATIERDRIFVPANAPAKLRSIGDMSPYRTRLRDYPTLSGVREVLWQGIGDLDGVRDLLSHVPGIGTLSGRGFGQVLEWVVERSDLEGTDVGWFAGEKVLRRLPASVARDRLGDFGEGVSIRLDRMAPPFWEDQEEVEVAVPLLRSLVMSRRAANEMMGI